MMRLVARDHRSWSIHTQPRRATVETPSARTRHGGTPTVENPIPAPEEATV